MIRRGFIKGLLLSAMVPVAVIAGVPRQPRVIRVRNQETNQTVKTKKPKPEKVKSRQKTKGKTIVYVTTMDDFPEPVDDCIWLMNNTNYVISRSGESMATYCKIKCDGAAL